ncbi:hypothetical protein LIER_08913 [Lithospermum erythrorhizon]|uniref:Transcription initiation factor TFIID subunit 8 n=1 Tax=Lithospermum erythrorhizon TaxID=34254 RepID=A0AAV3PDU6_LITER
MIDGGQTDKLFESGNAIEVVSTAVASSVNADSGRSKASENDFGRSVSRIAMAQICESVGFEGFNESALESLADIAVRYLFDLGKMSKFYANLAGRTDSNVFDIIQGLEDLGLGPGFSGGSEVNQCSTSSGVIREIIGFVDSSEEIPFAQPVPSFPVVKHQVGIPSFMQMGETPEVKHVPAWLPAFPDAHTYRRTPVWNERMTDPREDMIELARQRRKAERSLLSLQKRLVGNDAEEPVEGSEKGNVNGVENPFIIKPLQAGEKQVTPPIPPANQDSQKKVSTLVLPPKSSGKEGNCENYSSLLDAFAPAIEAAKDVTSESSSRMEISELVKRPALCLEFNRGKKVLREPFDLRLQKKDAGRTASWFGRDDERDDKKRRAEYILRQALENQQDLGQL